mgnify:CR=1 FL=1
MKRTFAQRSLMSLVAGFFLFGMLLLTANRASAQSTMGDPNTWKTSDAAQLVLEQEIVNLYNNVLPGLTPGSVAHNNKLAKAYYYRMIRRQVSQGMEVAVSVNNALDVIAGNNASSSSASGDTDFIDVSIDASLRAQLKAEAVDLLTL